MNYSYVKVQVPFFKWGLEFASLYLRANVIFLDQLVFVLWYRSGTGWMDLSTIYFVRYWFLERHFTVFVKRGEINKIVMIITYDFLKSTIKYVPKYWNNEPRAFPPLFSYSVYLRSLANDNFYLGNIFNVFPTIFS